MGAIQLLVLLLFGIDRQTDRLPTRGGGWIDSESERGIIISNYNYERGNLGN